MVRSFACWDEKFAKGDFSVGIIPHLLSLPHYSHSSRRLHEETVHSFCISPGAAAPRLSILWQLEAPTTQAAPMYDLT